MLLALIPVSLAVVVVISLVRLIDIDALYALYAGREVALSGLPAHDTLTAAASSTWVDQQWLGQWIFFETYRLGGFAGVVLLCMLLAATGGVVLERLMNRRGGAYTGAWSAAAMASALLSTPPIRTQTLAYPLFIALLWILTATLRRHVWHPTGFLTVPVLVVWANLHGSVLLGATFAATCMLWASLRFVQRRQRLDACAAAAVATGSALSILATPYGLGILHYYSSLLRSSSLRTYVSEWQPTSLERVSSLPFLLLLVLAVVTLSAGLRLRRARTWQVEVGVAVAAIGLGFSAARYVVWAVILVAYVASVHGGPPRWHIPARAVGCGRVIGAAVVVVTVLALLSTPPDRFTRLLPSRVAAAAATTATAEPGAVILADQVTSATVLWQHPEARGRVAFDIRYEQYRSNDIDAYFRFLQGHNPSFACKYGIVAISSAERPRLVSQLLADPSWIAIHDTRDGIVLSRKTGASCR